MLIPVIFAFHWFPNSEISQIDNIFSSKFIEPVGRLENFEDTITHITPFGNNKAKVLT